MILFKAEENNELSIKVIKDDIIPKTFINSFSINVIQQNKYFFQFDDLKEICAELDVRLKEEKISLFEETDSLRISIPLPSSKIKEIIFELKEYKKSDKSDIDIIKELVNIVRVQKEEIKKLREFQSQVSFLLRNYISNLDSLIVDNNLYNTFLKNWINPKQNIKANLLYRLSRDGPEISTFHKLCDNKGPTLTLFDLKCGYKIGYYVSDSIDSDSGWKKDEHTFLFNLNQNIKYKNKDNKHSSFCCKQNCGPTANGLGCNPDIKLNYIYFSKAQFLDKVFENGSKIFPKPGNNELQCEVNDTEIFQIIVY